MTRDGQRRCLCMEAFIPDDQGWSKRVFIGKFPL